MITLTKQFKFCYGHFLPFYKGVCCHQHGHNPTLEVTVTGSPEGAKEPSGMIIDFGHLKRIVHQEVIDVLDHCNINDMVWPANQVRKGYEYDTFFLMVGMPTAENIIAWIVARLRGTFGEYLEAVRLSETDTSWGILDKRITL